MNHLSFDEKIPTPLCEIMGRHGSDKGHMEITRTWHNYTTFYYQLFKDMKDQPIRLFELGLGPFLLGHSGASLRGWYEFFPYACIFGADIDTDALFQTNRITTFYCDQTNPEIIQTMWNMPILQDPFDIIIEDGLHAFEANVCFFENSIHKVKPKGYYVIEDIAKHEEPLFIEKIKQWETMYPNCLFKLIPIPSDCNFYDNELLVVYRAF